MDEQIMEKETKNNVMEVNCIMVSNSNLELLTEMIRTFKIVDPELIKCQQIIYEKLKSAKVLPDKEIPNNLAQLNSIVTVSTSFGRKVGLRLVLPWQADFHERKLSVLSSLGAALLGVQEGEKTLWHFPNGDELITIEKVDNSQLYLSTEFDN
jgi:regulator of nucleoside diphosphate kinase